jgi:hypothetical protein
VKWRAHKDSEHTIESDAGYSILQCTADGVPTGRFIAFAGRYIPIGGYDSREEAQQQCELHHYQTRQALSA